MESLVLPSFPRPLEMTPPPRPAPVRDCYATTLLAADMPGSWVG